MLNFDNVEPQTTDNPYIVIPEDLGTNQISLIKKKLCLTFSILVPLSFLVPGVILLGVFRVGVIIPAVVVFLAIPCLLTLLCYTYKIEITKDKANNTLTIDVKNYCRCKKKRYNFPLDSSVLKAKFKNYENYLCCNSNYCNIFVLNVDPKVKDIDNNNIKNIPYKFFTKFEDYIGKENDLNTTFSSFIENKFENNIEEEINLYSSLNPLKQFYTRFHSNSDIFVKISEHFYIFYNYAYLRDNHSNESFQRLDWIYTNDFDRIFIGVVGNDTTYVNNFIFNINSIDKIIFEVRFGEHCLKTVLKDGQNIEICRYKNIDRKELEIFINLINGQIYKIINGNNNGNNQDYQEKPVESDDSAPTII